MRTKVFAANNCSVSTVEIFRKQVDGRNLTFRKYKRTKNSTRRAELIRVTCLKRADEEYNLKYRIEK